MRCFQKLRCELSKETAETAASSCLGERAQERRSGQLFNYFWTL